MQQGSPGRMSCSAAASRRRARRAVRGRRHAATCCAGAGASAEVQPRLSCCRHALPAANYACLLVRACTAQACPRVHCSCLSKSCRCHRPTCCPLAPLARPAVPFTEMLSAEMLLPVCGVWRLPGTKLQRMAVWTFRRGTQNPAAWFPRQVGRGLYCTTNNCLRLLRRV